MRRCQGCNRPLPDGSAPQRKYCDHPECKRERNAGYQAKHRAVIENTLLAEGDLLPAVKRQTSMARDDGDRDEDWSYGQAGLWDEVSVSWQRANTWPPSHLRDGRAEIDEDGNVHIPWLDGEAEMRRVPRWSPTRKLTGNKRSMVGPSKLKGRRKGKLADVDKSMAKAEGAAHRHWISGANRQYGESAPPGPVRSNWRVMSAKRLPPNFDDRNCAGEMWLRGEHGAAVEKAAKATARWTPDWKVPFAGVWFTTNTPHGHAAMYANRRMPARRPRLPDGRIEAMRAAARKGLKVELYRDEAGRIVVRIGGPA